ncbi:MAG: hypothetical protein RIC15_10305 [Vicingaceae bacterium]
MKKNKLVAILLIAFSLLIPLNFGFLSIEANEGVVSLIMMILIQFAVLGAFLIGINKD